MSGFGDDLHQADAGAVQVHKRHVRVHVVDGFARVLFHVDAFNPHHARSADRHLNQDFALTYNRVVQLADLVALRQVRVEIVLAIKR